MYNNLTVELGAMEMLLPLKDVRNVIVMAMVMNNLVFVTQIQVNVIVNITLKEPTVNFARKDFSEIQSTYFC